MRFVSDGWIEKDQFESEDWRLKACSCRFLLVVVFLTVIPILPSQEKTKKEQHKKLGEEEETIPPEYRLTEAKVIYLMCLILLPFNSSERVDESETLISFWNTDVLVQPFS